MKSLYYILLLTLLATTGCDKDRIQFYLENFQVNDQYVDNYGKYPSDAILRFNITFRSDDPDDHDYAIENFDFSYGVNGSQYYTIQNDRNMNVDAFSINAVVDLLNLELPDELGDELIPGDKIEFRVWAEDSCGDAIEQIYEVEIK